MICDMESSCDVFIRVINGYPIVFVSNKMSTKSVHGSGRNLDVDPNHCNIEFDTFTSTVRFQYISSEGLDSRQLHSHIEIILIHLHLILDLDLEVDLYF